MNATTTPALTLNAIAAALANVRALTEAGQGAIDDSGDSDSRLLFIAGLYLTRAQALCRPTDRAMHDLGAVLFDVQALLQGCAALHAGQPGAVLASTADQQVEALHAVIDVPGFWPVDHEGRTP